MHVAECGSCCSRCRGFDAASAEVGGVDLGAHVGCPKHGQQQLATGLSAAGAAVLAAGSWVQGGLGI